MIARIQINKKKKTILTFAAILAILVVFGGSLQAELLVYEPFDYTAETQVNGTAVTGTGLIGTWSSNKNDTNCRWESAGLTYGDLPTAAGRIRFHVNQSPWAQASIDPAVLAGHLDDGDVLWFSVIANAGATGTSPNHMRFKFGTDDGNALGFDINRYPTGSGSKVRSMRAATWIGGQQTLSPLDYTFTNEPEPLVVGRITFGETDTIEIFMPGLDFTLPTPIATLSDSLNQSSFGMIRFIVNNGNSEYADEVRIGTSYVDVIGTPYAPEAIAGYNIATWSGEPVTMAPTVINNDPNEPVAPLNYLWTVEESLGVDVVISDPTIEAPIVTATRIIPYWWEIPIGDPSFEDVNVGEDGQRKWFGHGQTTPWCFPDQDGTAALEYYGVMYRWNPQLIEEGGWKGGGGMLGEVPDGVNCVALGTYLSVGDPVLRPEAALHDTGLAQVLDATYDPSGTYELTTSIGRSGLAYANYYGYKVELLVGGSVVPTGSYTDKVVGGTVIGSVESTDPIDPNTWELVTVTLDPNPANADFAGLPLQVRITSLRDPAEPTSSRYIIVDNVKLMTDAPLLVQTAKMKLSVNNEGSSNPPSASLMNIDVYEDSCAMTNAVAPEMLSDMDFDKDCIINLKDFALVASKWLDDYAMTAAEPK